MFATSRVAELTLSSTTLVSKSIAFVYYLYAERSGFELYCDLVYADWLIQSGICKEVIFHGKKIPWFVSDVTKFDWNW